MSKRKRRKIVPPQIDKSVVLDLFKSLEESVDEKILAMEKNRIPIPPRQQLEQEAFSGFVKTFVEASEQFGKNYQETLGPFLEKLKQKSPTVYQEYEDLNQKWQEEMKTSEEIRLDVTSSFPDDFKSKIFDLGIDSFDHQEFEQSYLFFNYLTFIEPKSGNIWLMKGISAQNRQDYDTAIEAYVTGISVEPENSYLYPYLAECLLLKGEENTAKEVYNTLFESFSKADMEPETAAKWDALETQYPQLKK